MNLSCTKILAIGPCPAVLPGVAGGGDVVWARAAFGDNIKGEIWEVNNLYKSVCWLRTHWNDRKLYMHLNIKSYF